METRPNLNLVNYYLQEDYQVATKKLAEYSQRIKELALEQAEGRSQSTENMGHDDAVQESVEQERKVLINQITELSKSLKKAEIIYPKNTFQKIVVGSKVTLSNGQKIKIGSFINYQSKDGEYSIASYSSPIAKPMLGLQKGDTFTFRGKEIEILEIV